MYLHFENNCFVKEIVNTLAICPYNFYFNLSHCLRAYKKYTLGDYELNFSSFKFFIFDYYLSKDFIVSIRFNYKNNLSSYTSHKKLRN